MISCEFYSKLSQTSSTYNWEVGTSQNVTATGKRGRVKGVSLNPVTAVAYKQGKGVFASNKRGTRQAGKALGLTKTFTENLYQATTNMSNRGHSQVVRGKIRSALEI
jgi:hypothetical protein